MPHPRTRELLAKAQTLSTPPRTGMPPKSTGVRTGAPCRPSGRTVVGRATAAPAPAASSRSAQPPAAAAPPPAPQESPALPPLSGHAATTAPRATLLPCFCPPQQLIRLAHQQARRHIRHRPQRAPHRRRARVQWTQREPEMLVCLPPQASTTAGSSASARVRSGRHRGHPPR
jgi:hypothetical protein